MIAGQAPQSGSRCDGPWGFPAPIKVIWEMSVQWNIGVDILRHEGTIE